MSIFRVIPVQLLDVPYDIMSVSNPFKTLASSSLLILLENVLPTFTHLLHEHKSHSSKIVSEPRYSTLIDHT